MKNSDFSFMRTGVDNSSNIDTESVDFLRMVSSIMKILLKEAIASADYFVRACGRKYITGEDTKIALKYEAHEFFSKNWDQEFLENLEIEKQHTYETESEETETEEDEIYESENEESEEGEELEDENDEYTTEFSPTSGVDRRMYDKMIHYMNTWDDWEPEDSIQSMLKRAINATP